MDIRKQIEWNLKALDTGDAEFVGTGLTWFAKNRDWIIEASTKTDNVYHRVFCGLHGLFERQFVKYKRKFVKVRPAVRGGKSKLKIDAIGLLPIEIRALLIRVMSCFSVRVLEKPLDDGYYDERADQWKHIELYAVEDGVVDQLEDILDWDDAPALRDSAICALEIISANGAKVNEGEILRTPYVSECHRLRCQEQLRKKRMVEDRIEYGLGGVYDCADDSDDVREDMGPRTNWPDCD